MFKEEYKEIYDPIKASESLKNSTLEKMKKERQKRFPYLKQIAYTAACAAMLAVIVLSTRLTVPLGELNVAGNRQFSPDSVWSGLYNDIWGEYRNQILGIDETEDAGIDTNAEEQTTDNDNKSPEKDNTKPNGRITKPMAPSKTSVSEEWGDCDQRYWSALQKFSFQSASVVLAENNSNENLVYSPASLYTSLSMMAGCTDGETKTQLLQAMKLSKPSLLQTEPKKAIEALYFENGFGKLKLANSMWLDGEYIYDEDLLIKQAKNCYTSAYYETFKEKQALNQIEQWIYSNTGGRINEMDTSLSKSADLAFFNTVYFNNMWVTGFNKKDTEKDTFTGADGTEITCKFMNSILPKRYLKTWCYQVTSLPMKNNNRMVFILPEEGYSVNDILSNSKLLKEAVIKTNSGSEKEIHFKLPLFNIQSQINLRNSLERLGIKNVFNDEVSDFAPLSEEMLAVSKVEQSACISINEKGESIQKAIKAAKETEKANDQNDEEAVSDDISAVVDDEIEDTTKNEPESSMEEMFLNKPFIFIVAKGNMPVMVGIVNNPKG